MNTTKKRVRASNFEKAEIKLLIDLATEYRDIIDNRRTDAAANNNKNEAWRTITRRFNETRGTATRSVKMLKAKYDNIKKTLHMVLPSTNGNETEEAGLNSILAHLRDSDSIATVSETSSDTDENNLIIDEDISQHVPEQLEPEQKTESTDEQQVNENKWQQNWAQYSTKTSPNKTNSHKKPAGISKRRNRNLSSEQLKLIDLQKQMLVKEMEFKKIEHEAKMQQIVNEEKRRQEIHDLNIKILINKNGLE